jgi:hypothetical protein
MGSSNPSPHPIVLFLPAHDEAATVGDVVSRAPRQILGHPVRVVVIDDGSTDGTAAVARHAGAEVERLGRNRGLGAAVRTGLALACRQGAVATAFCDADGEYAPEELGRMVMPVLEGRADYVVGSRFAGRPRRMRPHRWLGNHVLTLAMKALARRWGVRGLTDGQSGFRALSASATRDARIRHDFNYAQVLTLNLLAQGFRYAEVPISYRYRQHGRSFVRLGPYLRRVVPAVGAELRAARRRQAAPPRPARRRQSSTTKERKDSRAAGHASGPAAPLAQARVSAAAQPMARAWWVLSGVNRPWRPKVASPPSDPAQASTTARSSATLGR